jgi:hypothetical protein
MFNADFTNSKPILIWVIFGVKRRSNVQESNYIGRQLHPYLVQLSLKLKVKNQKRMLTRFNPMKSFITLRVTELINIEAGCFKLRGRLTKCESG